MRLAKSFYLRKMGQVQETLERRGLTSLLLLNHHQIYYLVGFFHFPTERPVALFIPAKGEPTLFVPKLEESFVHEGVWTPNLEVYFEYPGVVHPLDWIGERLKAHGFGQGRIGAEASASIGSRARLSRALPDVTWVDSDDIVADLRLIKEPEEIALQRRAAGYSDWMLGEAARIVRSGERPTEIELDQAMVSRVIAKMQNELDPVVAVPGMASSLVTSGPRTAFPHGLTSTRRIVPGENLVVRVATFVGGYFAESERTFLLGDPSPEQITRYQASRNAQEVGYQGLVPGARCGDVNRKCLDTLRAAGLGEYILHRQGHGMGIQNHEPPWIEDGDNTILQPGMVISCEPGIYCPGQGGYLISDSVVVTPQGPERITQFPRDLESIVIPI
jgi:Xaa-Pro dipeptidase